MQMLCAVTLGNRLDQDTINVLLSQLSTNNIDPTPYMQSSAYMKVERKVLKEIYGQWFEGDVTAVTEDEKMCTVKYNFEGMKPKKKRDAARLLMKVKKQQKSYEEEWTREEFHFRRISAKNNTPSIYEGEQVLIVAPIAYLRSTLAIVAFGTVSEDYHCTTPFDFPSGEAICFAASVLLRWFCVVLFFLTSPYN